MGLFFAGGIARAQTPSAQPDLAKLAEEAQGWLADLVRINTVNPPGNEAVIAKYIAAIFQKEGISNEVLEIAPGRSIVIARLQAGPLPDPANALLLVAHQDTVGVDPKTWTVDPFGAVVRDGYLYGRGSIDDKGMLAANIAVMVGLKRANARLARDVLFLATDDEEQGGAASIKVVIREILGQDCVRLRAQRRRPCHRERRQSAIRRHPGERKSIVQRHRHGHGDFGARLHAASG